MPKRQRDADGDDEEPVQKGPATIGQQTSHIRNKQVRSELYAKLKHKKKVRTRLAAHQHPQHDVHTMY